MYTYSSFSRIYIRFFPPADGPSFRDVSLPRGIFDKVFSTRGVEEKKLRGRYLEALSNGSFRNGKVTRYFERARGRGERVDN